MDDEIRQTNFRIRQTRADQFRKFCEEHGMNQAQGFDHVMQVLELYEAKAAIPGRAIEIESFEKSVKDIMSAYLYSLEINQNAEGRIHEQYASDLKRKDATIDELREKISDLTAEKTAAQAAEKEAESLKEQAEKERAVAEKVRDAAEKTAEDKRLIAETLSVKLVEAEKKANGYDALNNSLIASENIKKDLEQKIKDLERDQVESEKDLIRKLEKEKEDAIRGITETMRAEIDALREKLRSSESETISARKDAEAAYAKAVAEVSMNHQNEVNELRKRLDERTEDLFQAKQQISELMIELEKTKQKATKDIIE